MEISQIHLFGDVLLFTTCSIRCYLDLIWYVLINDFRCFYFFTSHVMRPPCTLAANVIEHFTEFSENTEGL